MTRNRMYTSAGLLLLKLLLMLADVACFSLQSPEVVPPQATLTTTTATATTTTGLPHNSPEISPATGLKNQFYRWRPGHNDNNDNDDQDDHPGMAIRYQCAGPLDGEPILLIHGLFVNSDHWRKALRELSSDEYGYRVYALDLFGCGYSDKPPRDCVKTQRRYNGENNRFLDTTTGTPSDVAAASAAGGGDNNKQLLPEILPNVELGSANGRDLRIRNVELRHPLGSPYNFYSWSELCRDFSREVIMPENKRKDKNGNAQKITLVANSIGTMSALQAAIDEPNLYQGVFIISPNFRELHSAEVPLSFLTMAIVRQIQRWLRNGAGQKAFDLLANPSTVKQILNEPYAVKDAVDDTLVQVLLDPLLTPGASDVIFDTLSYSAGPIPEQQLSIFPRHLPVWICYGDADPWTPGQRVQSLGRRFATVVERVESLPGVGHCPHDEAPELVHALIEDFMKRLRK